MSDFDAPTRLYTRPPMTRGVDPQLMNWLWQLILQATDLDPMDVRSALNAIGVGATDQLLASWQVTDAHEDYFPLTIAELERNLRAVIAWKAKREQEAETIAETDGDASPSEATAADVAESGEG